MIEILDFGMHALADTFIPESLGNDSDTVYPLKLSMETNLKLIQTSRRISAHERYNKYDYSYTASNSIAAREHWEEFYSYCGWIRPKLSSALEIGCNDGTLLAKFKDSIPSERLHGIDASEAMVRVCEAAGLNVALGLFSRRLVDERCLHGRFDLVIANNVLNHADNPLDFICAAKDTLNDDGIFVFEVPYWYAMVKSGRFPDMIYHEHVNYFTVSSIKKIAEIAGLKIVNLQIVPYHDQSLRVSLSKAESEYESLCESEIEILINREQLSGIFDRDFYASYFSGLKKMKVQWLERFYNKLSQSNNDAVLVAGASAKSNTWLTWHGLTRTQIDVVLDASPFKIGKYTPLSRIPIRADEVICSFESPLVLVTTWNISDFLEKKLRSLNPRAEIFKL